MVGTKVEYKWQNPLEWLKWRMTNDPFQDRQLGTILLDLASLLDSDQLQDHFELQMEQDGYFEPLQPAPDPYDEGWEVASRGYGVNTYRPGTVDSQQWDLGHRHYLEMEDDDD